MSICDNFKDCLIKITLCLYKQPYIKEAVNFVIIKYDEYCESNEIVELTTEDDLSELDNLLAELDLDEDLHMD